MSSTLEFRALGAVNEARSTNGLRQQDYMRYRKFCTKKLFKLRKSLNLKMDVKDKEASGFNFNSLTAELVSSDKRYLNLVLLETERAWAVALEAENDSNRESRKKFTVIRRLRRACIFSELLEKVCTWNLLDAISILEIKAYSWFLNGLHASDKENWKESREYFFAASEILSTLAQAESSSANDKALYLSFNDELEPSLRFCDYNLSRHDDAMDEGHDKKLLTTVTKELQSLAVVKDTKEVATLNSLNWFGNEIQLTSSEISRLVLRSHQAEEALFSGGDSSNDMEHFDELVGSYADMTQAANKLLEEDRIASSKILSSQTAEITANLHLLQTCAKQRYCTAIVLRNWNLAQTTFSISKATVVPQLNCSGRAEEVAQLTEKILQTLEEISHIPHFEEDYHFEQWVLSTTSFFKAFRMTYIGQKYAANQDHSKAFALFEKAHELFMQAKVSKSQAAQSDSRIDFVLTLSELEQWEAIAHSLELQAHAHCAITLAQDYSNVLERASSLGLHSKAPVEPVVMHLKSFPHFKLVTSKNHLSSPVQPPLYNLDPQLRPIPCKPIAFDVASKEFNQEGSVHQDLISRLSKRAGVKQVEALTSESSSGVLGGLISSLFGN
ncbi:signal recognition particle subunit srp68 [Entomophthora muscae]|uniref:Signal recognition particle subunit srp68 n=1 Tax=Entomophthora muscae TaxID=34485 RepID=A0ACC2UGV0_9FUNG|nr:signal recognition particle subunit srp68 [Entomophthora muscae]